MRLISNSLGNSRTAAAPSRSCSFQCTEESKGDHQERPRSQGVHMGLHSQASLGSPQPRQYSLTGPRFRLCAEVLRPQIHRSFTAARISIRVFQNKGATGTLDTPAFTSRGNLAAASVAELLQNRWSPNGHKVIADVETNETAAPASSACPATWPNVVHIQSLFATLRTRIARGPFNSQSMTCDDTPRRLNILRTSYSPTVKAREVDTIVPT